MEEGAYPIHVQAAPRAGAPSPLVSALVFILAIVATQGAVSRVMPVPESFREKFEYFAQNKDAFDLVFFGASETHWGISPEHFDDQLRRHGIELRSYNLAAPGSNGYEIDNMLRLVAGMKPERLKWVVVGWRPWRLDRDPLFHQRQVWWHSLAQTTRVFQAIVQEDLTRRERWNYAKHHGADAVRKFFHVGLGPMWIEAKRSPVGPGRGKWDYLARTGGFEGLAPETAEGFWPQGVAVRERFLEELDLFVERTEAQAARLAELNAGEEREIEPYLATLFPSTVHATQIQVDFLRSRGIEPLYLIPPSHEPYTVQRRLLVEGYIPALLAFNDPNEYPELFDLRLRYDHLHLTEEGAQLYSRFAADRFAEYLRSSAGGSAGG
jgi:hypothetical protein